MDISVIIPAYNRALTIARAIESVKAQTYKVAEIIVVDDGSSDSTAEVVKSYDGVLLLRQNNQGVSAARNNGAMMASSDWLAFLDSDDEFLPQKLECQVELHRADLKCKVSYTDEIWIRDGIEVSVAKKYHKPYSNLFEASLNECIVAPSSVVIERSYFDAIGGFDESFEICEDYDLWLRILQKDTIALIDQKLIRKYGGADDQLSRKHWGMDRWRVRTLHKLLEQDSSNSLVRSTLVSKYTLLLRGAIKHTRAADVIYYTDQLNRLDGTDI